MRKSKYCKLRKENVFEGMPIGLRSMIEQENQPEWYKQMYQHLNRSKKHNHYNNRITSDDVDQSNYMLEID